VLVGAPGAPGADDCDSSELNSPSPAALTALTANAYSVPGSTVRSVLVAVPSVLSHVAVLGRDPPAPSF